MTYCAIQDFRVIANGESFIECFERAKEVTGWQGWDGTPNTYAPFIITSSFLGLPTWNKKGFDMKVKDLIKELEKFNPEAEVELYAGYDEKAVIQIESIWLDKDGVVTIDGES